MSTVFLRAEWRNLIMANYEVDPEILQPYLPAGTELDFWNNRCYVSLVGFLFKNTRVLGIKFPLHVDFEEFNLRFYVRHFDKETREWKRGVVFIKEIVPKMAITTIANTLYGEHYQTLPMDHRWENQDGQQLTEYRWKIKKEWNFIRATTGLEPQLLQPDTEEAFITEHYWGYTRRSARQTSEYQVEHPSWRIYPVEAFEVHCNAEYLYGPAFASALAQQPTSVFMAEGSEVTVRKGKGI